MAHVRKLTVFLFNVDIFSLLGLVLAQTELENNPSRAK